MHHIVYLRKMMGGGLHFLQEIEEFALLECSDIYLLQSSHHGNAMAVSRLAVLAK
jgi:hypothetical protein